MCRIINSLLCLNNLISSINETISIWNAHRYMHKKYSKFSAIDVCTKTNRIHFSFFQFQFDVAVRTSFVHILFCLFLFCFYCTFWLFYLAICDIFPLQFLSSWWIFFTIRIRKSTRQSMHKHKEILFTVRHLWHNFFLFDFCSLAKSWNCCRRSGWMLILSFNHQLIACKYRGK